MIRLLLADAHAPKREELRGVLSRAAGLEIAGEAGTGEELLEQLPLGITVVLLDLHLPSPDALALLPTLRELYPLLRILAYADLTNEQYVARAFDLGSHGYLLKKSGPTELIHALRTVAAGRPFLCSAIGLSLLGRLYASGAVASDAARAAIGLSKREVEILHLVSEGMTNAEIAHKLFTSKRTIETHRQNIMEKTQAKNTAALIKMAMLQRLLAE